MDASTGRALALTLMGAAGTALGGCMVVAQPRLNFARLGALQGLAAGLMLSISILDLLPEAAEEIGFVAANLCFYLGVLFFAVVVWFIPEPEGLMQQQQAAAAVAAADHKAAGAAKKAADTGSPAAAAAGAAVAVVSAGGFSTANLTVRGKAALSRTASSGTDLPSPSQQQQQQQQQQQKLAVAGLGTSSSSFPPSSPSTVSTSSAADLDVVLDEPGVAAAAVDGGQEARRVQQQLLMSGIITAIGIALHNAPEGLAVYLASHKSPAVGISLAVAIALHNIPEGVAVALPVWGATGSRLRGLQAAVLSGLAEPLAVVLLALLFPSLRLDKHVVDGLLAGVGGVMAFLAFHELLPLAVEHAGKSVAVGCLFVGMGVMSLNLHVLNTYVLDGLH